MFTRNPERVEYIRRDPLSLREVTAEFFFQQAHWDRKLRTETGLDLPLLLLQAGDDPIVDREWVQGLVRAPALARQALRALPRVRAHPRLRARPAAVHRRPRRLARRALGRPPEAAGGVGRGHRGAHRRAAVPVLVRARARRAQGVDERRRPAHAVRRHRGLRRGRAARVRDGRDRGERDRGAHGAAGPGAPRPRGRRRAGRARRSAVHAPRRRSRPRRALRARARAARRCRPSRTGARFRTGSAAAACRSCATTPSSRSRRRAS